MTISGRLANFGSNRLDRMGRAMGRAHVRLYDRFGGRRMTSWLGRPVVRLSVVGRTSGEPRPVMLMLVRDGDDLLVCGSNGGNHHTPNWYLNLMAAGEATVTVGTESWDVAAREVDGEERDRAWELLCAAYPDFPTYQAHTDRRLPVAVLTRR